MGATPHCGCISAKLEKLQQWCSVSAQMKGCCKKIQPIRGSCKGVQSEEVLLPIAKSTLSVYLIVVLNISSVNLANCLEKDSAASRMVVYFEYMTFASDPQMKN